MPRTRSAAESREVARIKREFEFHGWKRAKAGASPALFVQAIEDLIDQALRVEPSTQNLSDAKWRSSFFLDAGPEAPGFSGVQTREYNKLAGLILKHLLDEEPKLILHRRVEVAPPSVALSRVEEDPDLDPSLVLRRARTGDPVPDHLDDPSQLANPDEAQARRPFDLVSHSKQWLGSYAADAEILTDRSDEFSAKIHGMTMTATRDRIGFSEFNEELIRNYLKQLKAKLVAEGKPLEYKIVTVQGTRPMNQTKELEFKNGLYKLALAEGLKISPEAPAPAPPSSFSPNFS